MNKQEAISQIMEIKALLPEHLQAKLIEAVKVLATFKMVSVDDDMPYNHPHLLTHIGKFSYGPLCVVRTEAGALRIDSYAKDFHGIWSWQETNQDVYGTISDWLPTRSLYGPHIMDELGNELKFE